MFVATLLVLCLHLGSPKSEKCLNNTDFKYDLQEPHQVIGYHYTCSEFADRTCCSPSNLEAAAKKVAKFFPERQRTSSACRAVLSNLMCSVCDSDIGVGVKVKVCREYCSEIYEACKNDYFISEANDRLRVCSSEDPVCSKLSEITSDPEAVCRAFNVESQKESYDFNDGTECWDGLSSSRKKGKPSKKIEYNNPNRQTSAKKKTKSKLSFLREIDIWLVASLSALGLAVFGIIKFIRKPQGTRIGGSSKPVRK